MNEEIEQTEETADEKFGEGYSDLDDVTQTLIQRSATELPDEVEPEVGADDIMSTDVEEASEPDYLFKLDDGTKVTAEEAEKGYLRQSDYTKKTQAAAEKARTVDAIYEYFGDPAHPERMDKFWADFRGLPPEQKPQSQQAAPKIEIPERYQGDAWVEGITGLLQAQEERIAKIEGGVNTIQTNTVEQQRQTERKAMLDTRLAEAYNELRGQVETPPTPEEFMKRLTAHYTELDIPIETAKALILSPDPTYLSAKVERIFAEDISKAAQAESTTHEKDRKKRATKATNLRVAGKSKTSQPRTLPKGPDGKIDRRASMGMILEAQKALEQG